MSFIQNLQNKSENHRKIILFFVVGILMVFVFVVWVFQFKNSLEIKSDKSGKELIPVSELTEKVVETYKDSSQKIQEIKGILEEIE